ncbi:MAG: response regulator [Bdellovibrionales bacterium]|nr:response regulator [Bdellovibrionales bacterium]
MSARHLPPKNLESKAVDGQVPLENRRVLVVDDEPSILSVYRGILDVDAHQKIVPMRSSRFQRPVVDPTSLDGTSVPKVSYEVVACESAAQALFEMKKSQEQKRPFAAAFLDVLLGDGMDGIQLAKELFRYDSDIQIVFVTAYQDRTIDSIHKVLGSDRAHQWDYLNKPFTKGEIEQKTQNMVSLWNLKVRDREQTTRLEQLRNVLMKAEKSQSIAVVARSVAHEFGNLLVQIIGKAELSIGRSPQEMNRALETILKAGETAANVLERFKSMADGRDVSVELVKMPLAEAVDEALGLLEHRLKTKNVLVSKTKWEHVEASIDKYSLIQVFVNLILNSIQAMGGSGQIDLSLRILGDHAEVRVRDYGPGFSKALGTDEIDKIFEPFFTTKKEHGGTGLGLSICKEIVEITHGGKIRAENHESKGAVFIILIPLQAPEGARE